MKICIFAVSNINDLKSMVEQIGTNAGLVWKALHEGGKQSVKDVKKVTKVKTEKELYAALGWLAKEGKLAFDEVDGDICIWLV